jgi:hypothetical protein
VDDHLSVQLIADLDDPKAVEGAGSALIASIERLERKLAGPVDWPRTAATVDNVGLARDGSSRVMLSEESDGVFRAVKTAFSSALQRNQNCDNSRWGCSDDALSPLTRCHSDPRPANILLD